MGVSKAKIPRKKSGLGRKIIKDGSEASIQRAVIQFLKAKYPRALYCASAGGMRTSYSQAARMKMTGYKRGFPDLAIYEPRNGYHGLFLELKKEGGYPSPEQKAWIEELTKRGYSAYICTGYDETTRIIDNYFFEGD
jgi:VRR-NUC domain